MDESILYELMKKFIDHAETAYKVPVLSADVNFKVQNEIKKKLRYHFFDVHIRVLLVDNELGTLQGTLKSSSSEMKAD